MSKIRSKYINRTFQFSGIVIYTDYIIYLYRNLKSTDEQVFKTMLSSDFLLTNIR